MTVPTADEVVTDALRRAIADLATGLLPGHVEKLERIFPDWQNRADCQQLRSIYALVVRTIEDVERKADV